jgi:hypothetical protein
VNSAATTLSLSSLTGEHRNFKHTFQVQPTPAWDRDGPRERGDLSGDSHGVQKGVGSRRSNRSASRVFTPGPGRCPTWHALPALAEEWRYPGTRLDLRPRLQG